MLQFSEDLAENDTGLDILSRDDTQGRRAPVAHDAELLRLEETVAALSFVRAAVAVAIDVQLCIATGIGAARRRTRAPAEARHRWEQGGQWVELLAQMRNATWPPCEGELIARFRRSRRGHERRPRRCAQQYRRGRGGASRAQNLWRAWRWVVDVHVWRAWRWVGDLLRQPELGRAGRQPRRGRSSCRVGVALRLEGASGVDGAVDRGAVRHVGGACSRRRCWTCRRYSGVASARSNSRGAPCLL
jgi:hypothetical protein